MEKVRVNAGRGYDCIIGSGILESAGEYTAEVKSRCKAFIVSDDTVYPLYGAEVKKSFENAGFETVHYVFKAGENSKNISTLSEILEAMASAHITRSDLAVALGGGVCGDTVGLAAALYLRGIDFVQIPTTFLAGVDSSVGGKTAVNLKAGKNLMGAFYQPILCICDCKTFDTLPKEVFADGVAESLKYGVIFDEELFETVASGEFDREKAVKRCIELKAEVVEKDERDLGLRQLLNFGHTVGHAIEKLSKFRITHGHAVAIGMVIASCEKPEIRKRIIEGNIKCGLPVSCEFSAHDLADAALSDKKRSGDFINLVVPEKLGKCVLKKTNVNELENFIEKGLHI